MAVDARLADALYNLGNAHRQAGEEGRAIDYISQAIQLQSGRADWQCNLGDLLVRKLRLDEAVASYEAALEIDSGDARFLDGRARSLPRIGMADEAGAVFLM